MNPQLPTLEPQPDLIGDFPFAGESQEAWKALQQWKDRLLDLAADKPLESLLVVVGGGALVFYAAEHGVNEQVNSYADALHYIATCLSVGYANIFPRTQTGRLVGALVMCVGPTLSSWLIEGRVISRQQQANESSPGTGNSSGISESAVLERLDAILAELRAARSS